MCLCLCNNHKPHYSHNEDYHSESSRGSDLSDIMEEDEEELYSEMQLEEGRRRNSHNTPKVQFIALTVKALESSILIYSDVVNCTGSDTLKDCCLSLHFTLCCWCGCLRSVY